MQGTVQDISEGLRKKERCEQNYFYSFDLGGNLPVGHLKGCVGVLTEYVVNIEIKTTTSSPVSEFSPKLCCLKMYIYHVK